MATWQIEGFAGKRSSEIAHEVAEKARPRRRNGLEDYDKNVTVQIAKENKKTPSVYQCLDRSFTGRAEKGVNNATMILTSKKCRSSTKSGHVVWEEEGNQWASYPIAGWGAVSEAGLLCVCAKTECNTLLKALRWRLATPETFIENLHFALETLQSRLQLPC